MINHPELTDAFLEIVNKIDAIIHQSAYKGEPIRMYVAGGMAMHRYCGTRYTRDVDAEFSRKILLPYDELVVTYQREDGRQTSLYVDAAYHTSIGLIHEDYQDDAWPWDDIQSEHGRLAVYTFSPIDLAISKVSRYASRDQDDILELFRGGWFTAEAFRERAFEAIVYYVGDVGRVQTGVELMFEEMQKIEVSAPRQAPDEPTM